MIAIRVSLSDMMATCEQKLLPLRPVDICFVGTSDGETFSSPQYRSEIAYSTSTRGCQFLCEVKPDSAIPKSADWQTRQD